MSCSELQGYQISADARFAFVARVSSDSAKLISGVLFTGLVRVMTDSWIAALLVSAALVAMHFGIPEMRLLLIERGALVVVRRAVLRRAAIQRIPFERIKAVVRYRDPYGARLDAVIVDGTSIDVGFRNYGRGTKRPRFASVVALGSEAFPVEPYEDPERAADGVCQVLAESGVTIQVKASGS